MRPESAQEAFAAGYMWRRQNYNGKVAYAQYKKLCAAAGVQDILVMPRTTYAAVFVTAPDGKELAPGVLLLALRALRDYTTMGYVRIDRVVLEYVPIDEVQSLVEKMSENQECED